ncbi:DUF3850 domain-containing protein [Burkholderia sp. R-70006]|nr:DUF3850 domain-containing protein [Burkholderia sp. R-70006]
MWWNHELKTDPDVFEAVLDGRKTHEIRFNDRCFTIGDTLLLRETRYTGEEMRAPDPRPLEYTGRELTRVVSHILEGYGLQPGWVILSFATRLPADRVDEADDACSIGFGEGATLIPGAQETFADGVREAARLVQVWQSFPPARDVLHNAYNRDSSRVISSWPARLRGVAHDSTLQVPADRRPAVHYVIRHKDSGWYRDYADNGLLDWTRAAGKALGFISQRQAMLFSAGERVETEVVPVITPDIGGAAVTFSVAIATYVEPHRKTYHVIVKRSDRPKDAHASDEIGTMNVFWSADREHADLERKAWESFLCSAKLSRHLDFVAAGIDCEQGVLGATGELEQGAQ